MTQLVDLQGADSRVKKAPHFQRMRGSMGVPTGYLTNPLSTAQTATCVREVKPSLERMLAT